MLLNPIAFALGVVDTKHNLSISGPGDVKSSVEVRVCIFCHTPHHANQNETVDIPLWSRSLSGAVYALYDSSSMQATPGQPTGTSRLCLSCHDGTVALGMLAGGYQLDSDLGALAADPTNLTSDLADDHPISVVYDSDLALAAHLHDPSTLPGAIKLENNQVVCSSCHDAHLDYYGKFLVMENKDGALCLTCHDPEGWTLSTHAPPGAECGSCHASHTADQPAGLLVSATEEGTCTDNCHNSSSTDTDVLTAFSNLYTHPVSAVTGVHVNGEDPLSADYHVECVDCHNPHQANAEEALTPGAVSGALKGVSGLDQTGAVIQEASREFEICYKCHADNSFVTGTGIQRQISEVDKRRQFDPANPTYHPVAATGRNLSVSSLGFGYDTDSIIYCTDCHNSSDSVNAGGSGANGPHGSKYPFILTGRYEQNLFPEPYAEEKYALCWRCHDPLILMAGGTFHFKHVDSHQTPCSACHDPHGIPVDAGAGSTFLINFDLAFVDQETAVHDPAARTCTVSCHTISAEHPTVTRSY
jgi:predicted CXXCH cytochrome family protein